MQPDEKAVLWRRFFRILLILYDQNTIIAPGDG